MNEFLLLSLEVPSKIKPELSYRFSFPYGAPSDEIFLALGEITQKIQAIAEAEANKMKDALEKHQQSKDQETEQPKE